MSTFKERLESFIRAEGISKSEFSRILGLSPAYVGSMRKSMPAEKIALLAEHFPRLNRDWLLYNEGEMYKDEEINEPEAYFESRQRPERQTAGFHNLVPLVPTIAEAGRLGGISDSVMPEDCSMIVSPAREATLAIRIKGDSMEPKIQSGTIAFLKKINSSAFIPWGNILVLDTENGTLVKVLRPSDDDDYILAESINPNYPTLQIPKESIYGIYRIVARVMEEDTY